VSASFLGVNRNKRGIVLDIEHPAGRAALDALVYRADVLIEDLLPAECARLHLTYEETGRENPRLIQCHVDYYGDQGPRRNEPGAELPVQAMLDYPGGLGEIGDPPVRVGADLGSMNAAVFAFQGVLAALLVRDETGQGQRVAVSVAGSLALLKNFIIAAPSNPDFWSGVHLDSWTKPRDHGYRTKDGVIAFSVRYRGEAGEASFAALLKALDLTHLHEDPRFGAIGSGSLGYGSHAHEVKPIWEEALSRFTTQEALEILNSVDAEVGELNDYQGVVSHPQIAALGALSEIPHPNGGSFLGVNNPWDFGAGVERDIFTGPPALGADTDAVLCELGYDAESIADLRRQGAIA
jgi:crotonobetainyl-CoA:carnitine CoA-transferase CaiB-like acyl-CoA transferase